MRTTTEPRGGWLRTAAGAGEVAIGLQMRQKLELLLPVSLVSGRQHTAVVHEGAKHREQVRLLRNHDRAS